MNIFSPPNSHSNLNERKSIKITYPNIKDPKNRACYFKYVTCFSVFSAIQYLTGTPNTRTEHSINVKFRINAKRWLSIFFF